MKRNYLSFSLAIALLTGCGGGGGSSGSSTPAANTTYRNVALASDGTRVGTQYDLEPVKRVVDGATEGTYWTTNSILGDDQAVLLFNRGKSIDKIVIYANDVDFVSKPITKTLSVAQFPEGPWYDVALDPDDPKISTKQTCTGSKNLTPDIVDGKSITCKFSPSIQFQYLRLKINSVIPASQFIYEIEAWGKDA